MSALHITVQAGQLKTAATLIQLGVVTIIASGKLAVEKIAPCAGQDPRYLVSRS